jgi:hypothetical protein
VIGATFWNVSKTLMSPVGFSWIRCESPVSEPRKITPALRYAMQLAADDW